MENFKHKRIIIIGGPGSGKTTLSERISAYTDIPVYHLDKMLLDSKWRVINKNEWTDKSKVFLLKDRGIIDGNYSSVISDRIKWADLIIFIDISTRKRLYLIFQRLIKVRLGYSENHGAPVGAREIVRLNFLLWSYTWNRRHKKKTLLMLESLKDKKIIITKSPRDLDLEKIL